MAHAETALAPRIAYSVRDVRFVAIVLALVVLVALPVVMQDRFITSLVAKMMIFAIAAASLDLIMGYGGMVSFGHAAFLGLGCYAVGITAKYAVEAEVPWLAIGYIQYLIAIAGSALAALFIGALSLRTSGLYFIMITLAFSQMIYYLGISLEPFGGDDGMNLAATSDFLFFQMNQNVFSPAGGRPDGQVIYYTTLISLVGLVYLMRRFIASRFGMVVRGAFSNEPRMQAIGFPTFRYKLTAFVISGAICGWAGALWANHQEFITPEYMHWFRSGEIMIMVIVGGMGTIYGGVVGAFAFLTVEEILKSVDFDIWFIHYVGTDHWPLVFGPLLVILVIFAENGILSLFQRGGAAERTFTRLRRSILGA